MSKSGQARISPKRGGENAAAAVIQSVPQLEHVPDTEAEWYDARVQEYLVASEDIPMVGRCLLDPETAVEIKSAMVVATANQSRGRFYLRRRQHEQLVQAGAVYLFVVCESTPTRDPIAMRVVAARDVDELVASWIGVDGDRAEQAYAQLAWSRVFDPGAIEEEAR